MRNINSILPERKCSLCGKLFIPAPELVYRDKRKGTMYCSYPCYNHRNDNAPQKTRKLVQMFSLNGELLKVFPSAVIASEHTGFDVGAIRDACRKQAVYYGYLWRYKE